MKTVLLVSANRHCVPYPVYPLGVSYLRGYLEQKLQGFNIEIFDCNFNTNEQLGDYVREHKPDYVGISLRNVDGANSLDRSSFIDGYKKIVDTVRANSSSPILIGGAGFSIYPQPIFDALQPNYGIIGEGEESLFQIISTLEKHEDPSSIEGIVCYKDGKFVCNGHTKYLKSLNVTFEQNLVDFYWQKSGMLNIQTKRGCPFSCIYCSYPIIDGRIIRTLDPDLIVENIARINKEKGVNYLFFTDSVFNISEKYNAELAEKLIKSGLKVRWGAYFAPHNLTDEMMELYRASGLMHIEFGTESFSDTQLANYGKRFTFDDVIKSSELCLKHNVYYAHFLILGGYGETDATLAETMEHSKQLNWSVYFPYFGMRIYPGTKLQELAIAKGVISKDDPLLAPSYYIEEGFDIDKAKQMALATEKAWIFPDAPVDEAMEFIRNKKNKKGVLWEYLRKP